MSKYGEVVIVGGNASPAGEYEVEIRGGNGNEGAGGPVLLDWHTEQVRKGAALLPPAPQRATGELLARFEGLPKPISTNALYVWAGKKRVKSQAYTNWLSHAGWKIKLGWRGARPLHGRLAVNLFVPPGKDIDNNCKGLLDVLTEVRVIVDDRYITELHVYREDGRDTCGIEIRSA